MLVKPLCLLIIIYINNNLCLSSDVPEVQTPLGTIQGAWGTTNGGRKYAAFEGVPYAKPPIGELRFEEPESIEPWPGVLNATRTYTCPQDEPYNTEPIKGEEDCLYLNIYVPAEPADLQGNFDVLVNIHAGAFYSGSGHTAAGAGALLDNDLVLVTINYRLGILGFLSTEDEAIPGNNGMKDQVLALRWIKDNIASFGGNPNSVTLTGISAGAASVHLHYFSPMSKGLFVRGLSQSGNALVPWAIKENPLENAKKLGVFVGCPNTSTNELKQCLKQLPALLFVIIMKQFLFDDKSLTMPFAPVIEKGSANPFLTNDPYLLLKDNKVLDVPWITSNVRDEGLIASSPYYTQLEWLDSDWPETAHILLDYNYTLNASKREEVAWKIKDYYLGPGKPINKDNFMKFTQVFTDRLFVNSAETAVKLQSLANKSPVYYYHFNYKDGENKMVEIFSGGTYHEGISHGDDLFYFYLSFELNTKSDRDLRTVCLNILSSYATTGIPSFDGTDKWQPTTDLEIVYLNITSSENIELQRTEHLSPVEFWGTLGLLENEMLKFKNKF